MSRALLVECVVQLAVVRKKVDSDDALRLGWHLKQWSLCSRDLVFDLRLYVCVCVCVCVCAFLESRAESPTQQDYNNNNNKGVKTHHRYHSPVLV